MSSLSKTRVFAALALAMLLFSLVQNNVDKINRRVNERVIIKLNRELKFVLTHGSGNFSICLVSESPYAPDAFGRPLTVHGIKCSIRQEMESIFEGDLTGIVSFSLQGEPGTPAFFEIDCANQPANLGDMWVIIGDPL